MKAIQYNRFGGPEVLEYVDVPVPSPGADEVLIETTAVGVNFPDIRERLGIYKSEGNGRRRRHAAADRWSSGGRQGCGHWIRRKRGFAWP